MERVTGQRAREGDDVAAPEQLGAGDVVDAGCDELFVDERVVGEDLASKGDQQTGDELTDAPRSDHARRRSVQTVAQQTVKGEVPVADALVGTMDVAIEGEDERQGVLGDGFGGVGGNANHGDAGRCRRAEVDVVVPGAPQRDRLDAELGETIDRLGAGVVIDEDAHSGEPRSEVGGARIEAGLEVLEIVAVLTVALVEGQPVVPLGVEHQRAHRPIVPHGSRVNLVGRATPGWCRWGPVDAVRTRRRAWWPGPPCW